MDKQNDEFIKVLQEIQNTVKPKQSIYMQIITAISLVVSIVAFLFSIIPQMNPRNSNYIERANAGDVEAQMFLAEHYFEVGENKESHYWYKIASMYAGDHQAAALNNVAYIGLTYNYYNDSLIDYQSKALSIFKKAAALGDKIAVQNMYTLLKELGEDTSIIDYEKELAWVIQVSYNFGVHIDDLCETEIKWALEQFQLNESVAYITEDGWLYYDGIGIYPSDDAFVEKAATYNSYVYHERKSVIMD